MIEWRKDGRRLPVADDDVCQTKYHRTCTGSLIIRDVQSSDVGEYRCHAGEGGSEIVSPPGRLQVSSSCFEEETVPTLIASTPPPCSDDEDGKKKNL